MSLLRMAFMRPAIQLKRLIGGNTGQSRYTRYLEKHQYDNPDKLKKLQAERLCSMMDHASSNVPYYKGLRQKLSLTPESAFDDIQKFPIVTKQLISENHKAFIDSDIPVKMRMKTGGTSHVKVEVIRDKSSHNQRNDEYFNRMIGVYPGMRRLILSRNERNYIIGKDVNPEDWIHYYHNPISGIYQVKPMPLTKEKLSKIYEFYVKGKPEYMRTNLNTGYIFAKYVEESGIKLPPLKILLSSGTQMVDEHRETFKKIYGADPINAYGASEINYVSSQCNERSGMHYIPMSHYIEIVDNDDNVLALGKPGAMIVTSLVHIAMPIIRYRIGDCGVLSDEQCACGRTYPIIKEILGRELEVIETTHGKITGMELLGIIKRSRGIADCIIIERKNNGFLVIMVKSHEYIEGDEKPVIQYINKNSESAYIEIKFVNKPPMLKNAKSLRVIPLTFDEDIENNLLYFG